MPAIVDYPQVVHEALKQFGPLFANEPQRQHLAEYLTGLFVAERKDVTASNREFAQATDPSGLNRFLTEADGDVSALNEARLDWPQQDPDTRPSDRGSIPLDNTLIDQDGKLIEDVGWSWDHAEARSVIAHDYRIANYVCPSGKPYPLEFRRFKKRAQGQAEGVRFTDPTELCKELVDWACARQIPGAFTFDSCFTNAPVLNHVHSKQLPTGQPRAYVGSLKFNRKRPGPDKAPLPGPAGVQPAAAATALLPCVGRGLLLADDHRPSLSGRRRRGPADHPRLGHLPGLRAGPRRPGRLRGLGPCQCQGVGSVGHSLDDICKTTDGSTLPRGTRSPCARLASWRIFCTPGGRSP
jgi:hypothetical protein